MLKLSTLAVTPFAQNCSLIQAPDGTAVVVDPGGDTELIQQWLTEKQARLEAIWLTHGHLDHVGAARELADAYQVSIIGPHTDDAFWLDALPQQAQMFGFPDVPPLSVDQWLSHGDTLNLAEHAIEVRLCPGHTPGHVVFVNHADNWVVVGDVLFRGGIGRTDFPRGNHNDLLHAIREQLFTLPDSMVVYPGHGPKTTIGEEKRSNPFVRGL